MADENVTRGVHNSQQTDSELHKRDLSPLSNPFWSIHDKIEYFFQILQAAISAFDVSRSTICTMSHMDIRSH